MINSLILKNLSGSGPILPGATASLKCIIPYSFMMRQGVEPQSVEAFNVFRHTLSAMYRVGAALELKALRYKMEKI